MTLAGYETSNCRLVWYGWLLKRPRRALSLTSSSICILLQEHVYLTPSILLFCINFWPQFLVPALRGNVLRQGEWAVYYLRIFCCWFKPGEINRREAENLLTWGLGFFFVRPWVEWVAYATVQVGQGWALGGVAGGGVTVDFWIVIHTNRARWQSDTFFLKVDMTCGWFDLIPLCSWDGVVMDDNNWLWQYISHFRILTTLWPGLKIFA